ncbi:MAG: hypothetical protein ACR2L2_12230 [Acidobacteriota bacterium]
MALDVGQGRKLRCFPDAYESSSAFSPDGSFRRGGKKRRAKLDEIRTACQRYLVEDLRPRLAAQLAEAISPSASADVINDA